MFGIIHMRTHIMYYVIHRHQKLIFLGFKDSAIKSQMVMNVAIKQIFLEAGIYLVIELYWCLTASVLQYSSYLDLSFY